MFYLHQQLKNPLRKEKKERARGTRLETRAHPPKKDIIIGTTVHDKSTSHKWWHKQWIAGPSKHRSETQVRKKKRIK